jgi:hypothetical protein
MTVSDDKIVSKGRVLNGVLNIAGSSCRCSYDVIEDPNRIRNGKCGHDSFFVVKVISGTEEMSEYFDTMKRIPIGVPNLVGFSFFAIDKHVFLSARFKGDRVFVPGILPGNLQEVLRADTVWEAFREKVHLVEYACDESLVGEELSRKEWASVMRLSDFGDVTGDFDRISEEEFQSMLVTIQGKLLARVYVTKLLFRVMDMKQSRLSKVFEFNGEKKCHSMKKPGKKS